MASYGYDIGSMFDQGNDYYSSMAPGISSQVEQNRRKQQQFQEDLLNLQSQNRMREFDHQLAAQREEDFRKGQAGITGTWANPRGIMTGGLNYQVQYEPGVNKPEIDPYKAAQLGLQRDIAQGKQDVAEQRANTYQEATDIRNRIADTPDYSLYAVPGGNIIMYDKKRGQMIDTKIGSGKSTDEQKATTKLAGQETLQTQRGEQQQANIAARTAGAQAVKQTPSAPPPLTEAAKATAVNNRAVQFLEANSDYRKFIKYDPITKTYKITPPGTNAMGYPTGPSQAQYGVMYNALYPKQVLGPPPQVPEPQQPPQVPPVPPQQNAPRPPPPNSVRVRNKQTGQMGYWDLSKGQVPVDRYDIIR